VDQAPRHEQRLQGQNNAEDDFGASVALVQFGQAQCFDIEQAGTAGFQAQPKCAWRIAFGNNKVETERAVFVKLGRSAVARQTGFAGRLQRVK